MRPLNFHPTERNGHGKSRTGLTLLTFIKMRKKLRVFSPFQEDLVLILTLMFFEAFKKVIISRKREVDKEHEKIEYPNSLNHIHIDVYSFEVSKISFKYYLN
jgi:hypothetical protein